MRASWALLVLTAVGWWGGTPGAIAAGRPVAATRRAEPPPGRSWALLIGVDGYMTAPRLRCCGADAKLLARVLTESSGFESDRVLVLTDDQKNTAHWPVRANLVGKIPGWLRLAGPNDRVIVFFSGHGFLDAQGRMYLAPLDCDPDNLALTGVPVAHVRDYLSSCKARVKLLILDTCHSGSAKGGVSVGLRAERLGTEFQKAEGLITLASCRAKEVSYEWPEKKHGAFTYWLAQGLGGRADRAVEGNRDGDVTLDELYAYVYDRVTTWSMRSRGKLQTPRRLSADGVSGIIKLTAIRRPPTPYHAAIRSLARELVSKTSGRLSGPRAKVAVGAFVLRHTQHTGTLGERLAADLCAALGQAGPFDAHGPADLAKRITHDRLWIADLLGGTRGIGVGPSAAGFALVVRGQYVPDRAAKTVTVRAELHQAQPPGSVGTATATVAYDALPVRPDDDEPHQAQQLADNLAQTATAVAEPQPGAATGSGRLHVRVWAHDGRKVYGTGDKLQFKVVVDRDAYVRLFDVRPDGTTVMLFPNAYHTGNFVRAGQVLTIPSEHMRFDLEVGAPFGPEAIQAVATTSGAGSQYATTRGLGPSTRVSDPFRAVTRGTRGLAEVIRSARKRAVTVRPKTGPAPTGAWAEDHWTFATKPRE